MPNGTTRRSRLFVLAFAACCLLPTAYCFSQPTQEQFFQSLQTSTDGSAMHVWQFLGVLAAAIGLIVLLVRFGQRATVAKARPQAVNHPRKLLREVRRAVPLRSAEWRQVRTLADEQSLQSPLTLLLCPSLLERAGKAPNAKADPRVVDRLVKKLRAARAQS